MKRRATSASKFGARSTLAFTLIEVMVALLIFFMAVFTILGLLANSLKNARLLQRKTTDCGPLATLVTMTNRMFEGKLSSDVINQFEDMFPDYSADGEVTPITNGLWEVDMMVYRRSGGNGEPEAKMTIYVYDANTPQGLNPRMVR